jgi:2-hydroxychromene-2-carboxylate isomerase
MALAAIAYQASPRAGEAVSLELRDLLFEQGVDVASGEVLADVAGRHGLALAPGALDDRSKVEADHAEGVARGVVGSPHFFTPAGGFFCPALDVRRDGQGHLRIHADPEGFEAFLDACFE